MKGLVGVPPLGSDFADRVVVHYLSTGQQDTDAVGGMTDLQPLPAIIDEKPSSRTPEELQRMLNSLIPDQSLYLKDDTEEDYEAWEAEISKGKQIFSDEENVGVIENNPLEGF